MPQLTMILLIIHFVACVLMTGVIWVIQLVHYPSFSFVSEDKFQGFNHFHQFSISMVVMPFMIIELLSGLLVLYLMPAKMNFFLLMCLLVLIWLSTFFLSVPLHNKLVTGGYNVQTIAQLVSTNWPRTVLWSLRTIGLFFLLIAFLKK